MSLFDLLFLASAFATVITLAMAVVIAFRGRGAQARRVIGIWGIGVAAYFAIDLAVDFFKPQRVIAMGAPWCFDDWCLRVVGINRTRPGAKISYEMKLQIYSPARGISQSAKGAWIYLIDEQGRRYSPNPDPASMPLSVMLGPEQSISTSRVFEVPNDAKARILGLVTGHGEPYCGAMSLLIIGNGGCLFNRPTIVRID